MRARAAPLARHEECPIPSVRVVFEAVLLALFAFTLAATFAVVVHHAVQQWRGHPLL